MLVSVRVGLPPVQLAFGHPAVAPGTVAAAVKVAGLVVNIRFPVLIALAGIAVSDVAGPSSTLFLPGAVLPPPVLHWESADPLTARGKVRSWVPSPASAPVQRN